MSTTDHKRAFRAPTDNDGGFYVHPNSLDDITLSNGTPGLQRIVATNQASAIGPYIVRGLDVTGNTSTFTVNAGEAVFKSGGVVSVVAATNTSIGGAGNYLYLSNAGTITREATPVKSDTKLLIDYVVGSAWVCTKQVDGKTTLGHKDVDIVDGILSVVDSQGTGGTTINTTSGITTSNITGLSFSSNNTNAARFNETKKIYLPASLQVLSNAALSEFGSSYLVMGKSVGVGNGFGATAVRVPLNVSTTAQIYYGNVDATVVTWTGAIEGSIRSALPASGGDISVTPGSGYRVFAEISSTGKAYTEILIVCTRTTAE